MDEYEVLEDELKEVYQEYVRKYRCLAYLEQQLEELERLETQEKAVTELNIYLNSEYLFELSICMRRR